MKVLPYPGLRPFEEKDRAIFFGREAQVVSVLALLEEQQFVAVVGSSGSGKSSLILAGVIPAVREGFLRGASDWKILVFKPGSDPCGNLARALESEGATLGHPAFPEATKEGAAMPVEDSQDSGGKLPTLLERLHAADHSLIDVVTPPGASSAIARLERERGELARSAAAAVAPSEELIGPRVLIVVDQFEELFTFRRLQAESGSKSTRFASRDEAATFVRLLLCACADPSGRIAVVITMRSDFIGDCDAFLDLPELVSRCQFLVPRLDRSQLREAIERPGQFEDLGYAPFTFEEGLVNRIIADAGDRLDQLPLMQHALMRTWKLAGGPTGSNVTLTHEHYRAAGRIAEALSKHADAAWDAIKDDAEKASLARRLFLLLCDVHPDGKIVRRRPLVSEVQAITGASLSAIEEIVRLFQSDDRSFLLPPLPAEAHLAESDHLDISHEALLRQWKEFGKWLEQEADSKVWLQELSQAARDCEKESDKTEPWQGNDLRNAEEWMQRAQPADAWARRHGVRNWAACLAFIERSRKAEAHRMAESEARARQAQEEKARLQKEKERRHKNVLTGIGVIAAVCFIAGVWIAILWKSAERNQREAERNQNRALKSEEAALKASESQRQMIETLVLKAVPIAASGKFAVAEAERQSAKLIDAIREAAEGSAPEQASIKEVSRAVDSATFSADAIGGLYDEINLAASRMENADIEEKVGELFYDVKEVRIRLNELNGNSEAWKACQEAINVRLARIEAALKGLLGKEPLDAALVEKKDKDILAATADLDAIGAIQNAAAPLGFNADDFLVFSERIAAIERTLSAARYAKQAAPTTPKILVWTPEPASRPEHGFPPLTHGGRVNRVRFAPAVPDGKPLIVAASDDRTIGFWRIGGFLLGKRETEKPVLDIDFNSTGDAVAFTTTGTAVRVARWSGLLNIESIRISAFTKHSDQVADVEFSHGGERIASAGGDRTVRVFDSRSMAQLYFTSPPLPEIVTAIAFHPRDNLVVSGCDDGGVRLHTINQPSVQLLGKFDAPARRPEFSSDGKFVLAASGDKTARMWPIVAPREIVRIGHEAPVTHATFRPVIEAEGYTFITTASNGEVRSIRVTGITGASANPDETALELRHPGAALFGTWSGDGRWLATVGGGEVIVWEWVGDAPVARLRLAGLHPATSRAEFSPDAKLLVTYGGDHVAHVWDLTPLHAEQR